jgi:hypothetical protein
MSGLSPASVASPPVERRGEVEIFLIAVEESGDRLGGALMRALKERASVPLRFTGVGGREMAAAGLTSLLPVEDFSIIGFTAIPRRLPRILSHMYKTVRTVLARKPHALVIIDSPGYTSGCTLGPSLRSLDPDRRLRLALGVGLAVGPRQIDARLYRPRAGAAAVRARRAPGARRAALQLCRPSADRGGR